MRILTAAAGVLVSFWIIRNIVMTLQSIVNFVDTVASWGERSRHN
jgi:hypothetical protein